MTETIKLFTEDYYKKNKVLFFTMILLIIIYYFIETYGFIFIFRKLIKVNKQNSFHFFIFISIFSLILVIFGYFKRSVESEVLPSMLKTTRTKYINLLYDYVDENYKNIKIGSVIARIYLLTSQWNDMTNRFFNNYLPNYIVMISIILVLIYQNKGLALILTLCLIVSWGIIFLYGTKKIINNVLKQNSHYYKQLDYVNNQLNNLLNIIINNQQKREKNIITNSSSEYNFLMKNTKRSLNHLETLLIINLIIFIIATIIYIIKNNISNKSRTVIILCLIYFVGSYLKNSSITGNFLQIYGNSKNNVNFLKDLSKSNKKKSVINVNKGSIIFYNVFFSYDNNNFILNKINLEIEDKNKVAIIGRSGYGKTTLCKLLLKLYKYKGIIKLDNIDIQEIDSKHLREKITYINQKTTLYDTNIIKNMNYGNNVSEKKIINLLRRYDLEIIFSKLENGIYENINHNGDNLSLGMQKIIILIRGILKIEKSSVIIFDEPLSSLDLVTKKKVIKMILQECSGKTIIVVTHDKEILPYMDKIINIEKLKK